MIESLLGLGIPSLEIQVLFSCGSGRIQRLRNPEKHKRGLRGPKNVHAVTEEDINRLKTHLDTFDKEQGFACAHRRQLSYFTEEGLKWRTVHNRYQRVMETAEQRVLSYER